MAPQRLSWRRSAAVAAAGLAAAQVAGGIVLVGFDTASERESSGIGAAGLMIFLGYTVSIAMYFLVGGAIFRIAARRLHGRISYAESMLVLLVAGAAFLLVGGLVSGTVDDGAVILAAAFPAGVLVGAAIERRRVHAITIEPAAADW